MGKEKKRRADPEQNEKSPGDTTLPAHMIDVIFSAIQDKVILDIIERDDEQIKFSSNMNNPKITTPSVEDVDENLVSDGAE